MKTSINFILDKSGSMADVHTQTISGFNEFMVTQDKDDDFTLTLFDQSISFPEEFKGKVSSIPKLDAENYVPGGSTALYDAIGRTIHKLDTEFAVNPPEKVVIVIQTDGYNNSSREFTRDDIFDLIKERSEGWWNWEFIFLGADQDAYAASSSMGIGAGQTVSYASVTTGQTISSVGRAVADYSSGVTLSTSEGLKKTKEEVDVQHKS